MKNLMKYGKAPYTVAVIHGGPGARGDMAPVAKVLSKRFGVLEPLQTAASVNGQIKELCLILKKYSKLPIILIGHSWGAWLSYIFTAKYPRYVSKLILVSSGPFEEKYVAKIMKTRLSRVNIEENAELNNCIEAMNNPRTKNKDLVLTKFGDLVAKTDSYKTIPANNKVEMQYGMFKKVWKQAEEIRRSGQLLNLAKQIRCPVVAIQGDYDPHPYKGVEKPLSRFIRNFRFILLNKCGHYPWLECFAKKEFYSIIIKELT